MKKFTLFALSFLLITNSPLPGFCKKKAKENSCASHFIPSAGIPFLLQIDHRLHTLNAAKSYSACMALEKRDLSPCGWLTGVGGSRAYNECVGYSSIALLFHLAHRTKFDSVDLKICDLFGQKLTGKNGLGPQVCRIFEDSYLRGRIPCGEFEKFYGKRSGTFCQEFFRKSIDHDARNTFAAVYRHIMAKRKIECGTSPFDTPFAKGSCQALRGPYGCDADFKYLVSDFCKAAVMHPKPRNHKRRSQNQE
jgi:hypothetical protein